MTFTKVTLTFGMVTMMLLYTYSNAICQIEAKPIPDETIDASHSGAACLFSKARAAEMRDPRVQRRQEAIENELYRKAGELLKERRKVGHGRISKMDEVLTIPLIIHVIHLSSEPNPGDGASNPTDAQVLAGIQHLNDAYRNVGVYAGDGHQSHPALQSVDVGIEFCLAERDINGDPTTGILRYSSDTYSNLNFDLEDPHMQEWVAEQDNYVYPGTDYAHVWLVNDICSGTGSPEDPLNCNIAGYAYFPGGHGQVYNGVVNLSSYWGTSSNSSKIHIHEFGHYLNLFHTFQGGCTNNDCLADGDRVCDTPPDNRQNFFDCGEADNSCSTDTDDTSANNPFQTDVDDLYENYMDYTANSCQNTFTQGQKDRMRSALQGPRGSLLSSQGCIPVEGAEAGLNGIVFPDFNLCNTTFSPIVEVQNNGNQPISSLTFAVQIDGNPQPQASWNGTILPGATDLITLSPVSLTGIGLHELQIEILTSNGQTDPFPNNNSSSKTFKYSSSVTPSFCTDLETNALPTEWTVNNPDDFVGFEPYGSNTCAENGNYILGFQTWGAFPSQQTIDQVLTQPIDLSMYTGVELTFDIAHAFSYTNFNTILDVSISTDCGLSYSSVYNKTGQDLATLYVEANSANDPEAFYVPQNCNEWRTETISLEAYADQEILIRFEASTADIAGSSFGYYWGNNLYVDNICLSGNGPTSNCDVEELELLSGTIATGTYNDAAVILAGTDLAEDANVQFEAAESIFLLPGFNTEDALAFHAVIAPCDAAARIGEAPAVQATLPAELEETPQLQTELLPKMALKIHPNPFTTTATVSYYFEQPLREATLVLSDLSGQNLRTIRVPATEAGWHQFTLEQQDLPAGIYFLQLRTPEQLVSKKLIIL